MNNYSADRECPTGREEGAENSVSRAVCHISANMGGLEIFEQLLQIHQMRQENFSPLGKWVLSVEKPLQCPDIVID